MRLLRAFGLFWYDFLIGDDWKIAAYAVAAIASVAVVAVATGVPDEWLAVLATTLLMSLFACGVSYDARKIRRPERPR